MATINKLPALSLTVSEHLGSHAFHAEHLHVLTMFRALVTCVGNIFPTFILHASQCLPLSMFLGNVSPAQFCGRQCFVFAADTVQLILEVHLPLSADKTDRQQFMMILFRKDNFMQKQ